MKTIFSPAIWLVGRLSYPHKLLLTAAAFLIPLLILAGLLVSEQQKTLAFTHREQSGLSLQLPALELLAALHDHHASIQAAHAGNETFQQHLSEKRDAVDKALFALNSKSEELFGSRIRILAWDELNERWKVVATESPDTGDGLDAHLELNRLLRNGLTTISDNSGIRVDSDPVVAALVDSISIKLPLLMESLGLARDIGLGAVISKRLKSKLRNRLQVVRGGIDPLIAWNIENVEKAITLQSSLRSCFRKSGKAHEQ